jgi:carotenoid 1,2-hydratase
MDGVVQSTSRPDENCTALPSRWSDASGPRRANGGVIGPSCSQGSDGGPQFAAPVGRNGYAWWYVDALSDDERHGLTIIALIGSVFSPYYARARRKGRGDPLHHVAMNVALYGTSGKRWAMTERGRHDIVRDDDTLRIGPSALHWGPHGLTVDIDEVGVPFPKRMQGQVKLYPAALQSRTFQLDDSGHHVWQPIAPVADVEVSFRNPSLSWKGHGYFDRNCGTSPIEDAFKRWHWSRASSNQTATIFYDVTPRAGSPRALALQIDAGGEAKSVFAPPYADLPSTGWRIDRMTRSDAGVQAGVISTLEDTPFYARSIVSAAVDGKRIVSMHESLDLDRFRTPIVQAMLPFRMPRRARSAP